MRQDLRHAFRLIARRPGVSALTIITLAIGIAASTIGFSLADAILWHPLPFPDADRLVRVRTNVAGGPDEPSSASAVLEAWPAQEQILDGLYPFGLDSAIVTVGDEPQAITIGDLSPGLLGALGVTPAWGRDFRAEDLHPDSRAVIVSGDVWRRVQASGGVVRLLAEGVPQTIVGVMPDGVEFPVSHVSMWRPYAPSSTARHITALGKLKRGVTIDAAQAFALATMPGTPEQRARHLQITPFVAVSSITSRALHVLVGAVALLLLIAVANAANVILSEAVRRDPELALRASLGASWLRLARQIVTETLVVSTIAAFIAMLVSAWSLGVLVKGVPYLMSFQALRPIALDWRALSCAVVIAGFAGLVASCLVVIRVRRMDAQVVLRGQTSGLPAQGRIRNVLTVAQISVTLALLASAGLLANSLLRLSRSDPGFDPDHVVVLGVQLPATRLADESRIRAALVQLRTEAASLPDVLGATVAYAVPPGLDSRRFDDLEAVGATGQPGTETVWFGRVDGAFFSTLRVPVLAGRGFDTRDGPAGQPVAIVSRALAARWWPDGEAVGRRFRESKGDPWRTVVGVVGDVTDTDVEQSRGQLAFYTPRAQAPTWWFEGLIVRTLPPPAQVVPELRALLRRTMPDVPITEVSTAGELIGNSNARVRFATGLMTAFATAALVLALIGVYGTFWYAVRQRAREIAVRVALGAERADVLRMILGTGVRLVLIGLAVGLPLALASARSLRALLFEISPDDPATFAAVVVFVAVAAIAATYLPARRASMVDPLEVLRNH